MRKIKSFIKNYQSSVPDSDKISSDQFRYLLFKLAEEQNKDVLEVCNEALFRVISKTNLDVLGDNYVTKVIDGSNFDDAGELVCFGLTMNIKAELLGVDVYEAILQTMNEYNAQPRSIN